MQTAAVLLRLKVLGSLLEALEHLHVAAVADPSLRMLSEAVSADLSRAAVRLLQFSEPTKPKDPAAEDWAAVVGSICEEVRRIIATADPASKARSTMAPAHQPPEPQRAEHQSDLPDPVTERQWQKIEKREHRFRREALNNEAYSRALEMLAESHQRIMSLASQNLETKP